MTAIGDLPEPSLAPPANGVPLGRRSFIAGVAGLVTAAAMSERAAAVSAPPGSSYFQSVRPVRLADTRRYGEYATQYKDFQRLSDRLFRIDLGKRTDIPDDAVAVVVTIAAISNGRPGWVHAVPAGTNAVVANVNIEPPDDVVSNLATVRLSNDGKIDVRGWEPYDVTVDVLGVYRSTNSNRRSGRVELLPETVRVVGNVRLNRRRMAVELPRSVPATARAVIVNLAAAGTRSGGYLTAVATGSGALPTVSSLNFARGEDRSGGAIVQVGVNGRGRASIDVYAEGDVQLYVDVTGYVTGEEGRDTIDGLFVPINPYRVMDTRRRSDVARTGKLRLWPGWTRAFTLPDRTLGFGQLGQMSGLAMNVTIVGAMTGGYVTVLPAQTVRQVTSNLNVSRVGQTVANHAVSRASDRGIELYARCGGHLVVDVAGWYVGQRKAATLTNPPADPAPPAAAPNWLISATNMSLTNNWVLAGANADAIVDAGHSWYWTNSGLVGQAGAQTVVFGHRTSAGGPYRNQHFLEPGSELVLATSDQREYRYRYVGERLTSHIAQDVLNAAQRMSGGRESFTLVSCTGRGTPASPGVKNDQPSGGIAWRLVSTFEFVSWRDTGPTIAG